MRIATSGPLERTNYYLKISPNAFSLFQRSASRHKTMLDPAIYGQVETSFTTCMDIVRSSYFQQCPVYTSTLLVPTTNTFQQSLFFSVFLLIIALRYIFKILTLRYTIVKNIHNCFAQHASYKPNTPSLCYRSTQFIGNSPIHAEKNVLTLLKVEPLLRV
ncbi:hypothetical protein TNCV_156641 [Trichonephila clavipes]|nr:hypothetical protein TNCV_156641 [Trichonephila clavipes]